MAHLRDWQASLDEPSQPNVLTRKFEKTPNKEGDATLDKVCLNTAWDEYVRNNVVSETAAKLIQTFLLNTMASSGKQADDAESEADESADDTELHPLKLPGQKLREGYIMEGKR